MAQVGPGFRKCARCETIKPETTDHFYFGRNGHVTGWCRPCQKAYVNAYPATMSAYQRQRRRAGQRAWYRAKYGVSPDRWALRYRPEEVS